MTEEIEMWTVDDLVAMVNEVQTHEIEWAGKALKIQWCELVEAEEPKMAMPDDEAPSEEQTEYYKKLAGERVLRMIEKGNEKSPDSTTITQDNWAQMPTTLRWQISSTVLGQSTEKFTSG